MDFKVGDIIQWGDGASLWKVVRLPEPEKYYNDQAIISLYKACLGENRQIGCRVCFPLKGASKVKLTLSCSHPLTNIFKK